jgi:hypothetical protein
MTVSDVDQAAFVSFVASWLRGLKYQALMQDSEWAWGNDTDKPVLVETAPSFTTKARSGC